MQLIQPGTTQQISGEVVAGSEVGVGEHLAIEGLQLCLHGGRHSLIRLQIHLKHRGWKQPVKSHQSGLRRSAASDDQIVQAVIDAMTTAPGHHRVHQQHGHGHRADPTRHRRQR